MNLQSIPVLMMSAVCLYAAGYYFITYYLGNLEREKLTFAMTCLSVFFYDLTCAGLYNASGVEEGIFWQRGNFISTALISISVIWFVSDFTKTRIGKRAISLSLFFLMMITVLALGEDKLVLTPSLPSVKKIEIGSLLNITYYEGETGLLCSLFLLVMLVSFIYLILILIRFNRSGAERKTIKIIVSFCIFFIGVLNDIMVASGFYNFIYISEYVFMYIIIIMGYELQVKYVKLQKEVELLNRNLEFKVKERTIELIEKQKKIEEEKNLMAEWQKEMDYELRMARCIQLQIIPENNPVDYISALFRPMAPIGGDFYDFIKFREPYKTGIFISDVSGHGIPAALITTMIKSLVSESGSSKLDPAVLLANLNETLVRQSGENFVTAFYGIYDRRERTIMYSCAGHNPPLLIHDNKIIPLDRARSMPLGIRNRAELAEIDKSYTNHTEPLPAGSKIMLYTDGLFDTRREGEEKYYFENIINTILPEFSGQNCRGFVDSIYRELVKFRGSENFEDDVCIICVDVE